MIPAGGLDIASLRWRWAKVPRSANDTGRGTALGRHGGPPIAAILDLPDDPGVAVGIRARIDRR